MALFLELIHNLSKEIPRALGALYSLEGEGERRQPSSSTIRRFEDSRGGSSKTIGGDEESKRIMGKG